MLPLLVSAEINVYILDLIKIMINNYFFKFLTSDSDNTSNIIQDDTDNIIRVYLTTVQNAHTLQKILVISIFLLI